MNLWHPIVPPDQFHPNFQQVSQPQHYAAERAVVDGWSQGFVDRDGKFVKEFQTTFNSCFWEMYLFACFKELGVHVDFSHAFPDFVTKGHSTDFVAEAVIASNPDGYAPEWEPGPKISTKNRDAADIEKLLVLASIRLSNAITSKLEKYRKSYATHPHVAGKPYVICAAPFEQPLFFMQNDNALRRVLYGFDRVLYFDDEETGERQILGQMKSSKVHKHTGTPIDLGLFTNPNASEISAVIFSNTATMCKLRALSSDQTATIVFEALRFNENGLKAKRISAIKKDYRETLLDGLHVCLNPFAKIPFDLAVFTGREISIHRYDPNSNEYFPEAPDGFLYRRRCMELRFTKDKELKQLESRSYPEYSSPDTMPWKEGELIPVEANLGIYGHNFMAHYKGWTLVVARDPIDHDWNSQAIKGIHRDMAAYVSANSNAEVEDSLILSNWHPDKGSAFHTMKQEIDNLLKKRSSKKQIKKNMAKLRKERKLKSKAKKRNK